VEKPDTTICRLGENNDLVRRSGLVSCVYVVGVIGLSPAQTHYSVMVKAQHEEEPIVLREGTATTDEIKEATPKYFMFSIFDPNVIKVTIQLTTIHGDPDLFVSRKTKTPSFQHNERRSIRCGIFPEIIEIR